MKFSAVFALASTLAPFAAAQVASEPLATAVPTSAGGTGASAGASTPIDASGSLPLATASDAGGASSGSASDPVASVTSAIGSVVASVIPTASRVSGSGAAGSGAVAGSGAATDSASTPSSSGNSGNTARSTNVEVKGMAMTLGAVALAAALV
ncbi:hypothetical protein B0H17DRAFT_1199755 [Mycena rosella]|uniref:Uncharacterized protein n=1 Tax=Mycena rosella TaxID=1033263 RepID=A0AAD7DK48_MYCRO|nr:hypothetical protein B0H17DRAFT_1199755 [Mycena rosella]